MYICPKCSEKLTKTGNTLKCVAGHCFDIASAGYVNLLLGSKKSGSHGDNKEMITARRRFLSLGHYAIIIDKLCEIIAKYCKENNVISPAILDAGCGEGYYSGRIFDTLRDEYQLSPIFYAADVSKDAVFSASKTYKTVNFSVASVNKLPFGDLSFDIVLSLFAPLSESEFDRVLKPDGRLITVSPSENHLIGLKEIIYETPYKNPPSTFIPKILTKLGEETVVSEMTLYTNESIKDLFSMTPYYYNTCDSDKKKLEGINELNTEIGFVFGVFGK